MERTPEEKEALLDAIYEWFQNRGISVHHVYPEQLIEELNEYLEKRYTDRTFEFKNKKFEQMLRKVDFMKRFLLEQLS